MNIIYCEQCGKKIPPEDVDSGAAQVLDEDYVLCATCRPLPAAAPASPPVRSAATGSGSRIRAASGSRLRAEPASAGRLRAASASRIKPARRSGSRIEPAEPQEEEVRGSALRKAAAPADSRKKILLLIGGIGLVVVLFAAVFLLNQRGARPASETSAAPSAPPAATPSAFAVPTLPDLPELPKPPKEDDYDPRGMTASTKLAAARQYAAAKPEDVWGYHARLDDLVKNFDGTPAAEEAKKLLADVKLPPGPPPSAAPVQPPAAPAADHKKPAAPAPTAAAQPAAPKPEPAKPQPAKPVQENILMEFDFTQGSSLGWKAEKGLESFAFGKDGLATSVTASDASMILGNMNLNTALVTHVSFRIKSDKAGETRVGYTTSKGAKFEMNDAPSVKCLGDNQWREYLVKLSGLKNYEGQLRSLRLAPINGEGGVGAKIEMRWIRLVSRE